MMSLDHLVGKALSLGLIEIIWESNAYIDKEEEVPRSLWERLFSLPWKPFKKMKLIVVKEPTMYSFKNPVSFKMMFICHPVFKERIMREFSLVSV